jgi:mannan endo-1,4-beta-mannosidase
MTQYPLTKICVVVSLLFAARAAFGFAADTPVTPGASPEAQSLLTFFADTYGRHIISGQQDGWRRTNGLSQELSYITNTTGKLPALLANDVSGYTDKSRRRDTNHFLMKHAADWYLQRNGIVEFCWHWRAPMNEPSFYVKETTFDIKRAVTEGTPEHTAMLHDLDLIADELEVLRDAHVPVLWRPLHEANGRWFWWGAGGPEPFKQLWRQMFEVFTVKHHLNNLIWVFSPGAETDLADWYPGDAYVDIVGQDHYPMDGNHGSAADVFDELNHLTRGTKLIALGENGPVPDPELILKDKAGWLYFTTWSGRILYDETTPQQLREYYNNPYVLNLGDLPDLKTYHFKPTGTAAKLAFPAAPGDAAIGGVRRSPLTVAVEDAQGRTVREGNYSVTLALKVTDRAWMVSPGRSFDGGTLDRARFDKDWKDRRAEGAVTVATVNGIATFPELEMAGASGEYKWVATANGLRGATSKSFHLGPGDGLLRELWLRPSDFSMPADVGEILDRALETPVSPATNFSARIRGQIIAPQSGAYQFRLAAGGIAELWLSTDAAPANAVKIAAITPETPYRKWPHINEADSEPVTLHAGARYYLEIRQWQNHGSTQLHVGWQLPDGTYQRPIPAYLLTSEK